jgi:hypothetical protein
MQIITHDFTRAASFAYTYSIYTCIPTCFSWKNGVEGFFLKTISIQYQDQVSVPITWTHLGIVLLR